MYLVLMSLFTGAEQNKKHICLLNKVLFIYHVTRFQGLLHSPPPSFIRRHNLAYQLPVYREPIDMFMIVTIPSMVIIGWIPLHFTCQKQLLITL